MVQRIIPVKTAKIITQKLSARFVLLHRAECWRIGGARNRGIGSGNGPICRFCRC
jgi:hypothetical protein